MTAVSPVIVLLAVCNGEKYLPQQLKSIQEQLSDRDIILAGLDPSTDTTVLLMQQAKKDDPRIRIIKGPAKGACANFENLLMEARKVIRERKENPENVLIALADQDDIWRPEKIARIRKLFEDPNRMLTVHDARLIDSDNLILAPSYFQMHHSKNGLINNLIRNSFIGCCMVFRANLIDEVLPFPDNIPMHDQWIGMRALQLAAEKKDVLFAQEKLIDYRRHENNATSLQHAGLLQMLRWRTVLVRELIRAKGGKK